MTSYAALRAIHNELPAEPSGPIREYADAIQTRDDAFSAHERTLERISNEMEARIATIPADAADRDRLVAAEHNIADRLTATENELYNSTTPKLTSAVDKTYAALSPAVREILERRAPDLGEDQDAAAKIARYIATLDDATKELIVDLNNQSASTSIDIAVGYLSKDKFLRIPSHLETKIYELWDSQQTTETYANGLTAAEILAVAAVNLPCFAGLQGAEFLSFVRAYTCAIIGAPSSTRKSLVRFHEVTIVSAETRTTELDKLTGWMKTNASMVRNIRYFVLNFICLSNHVLLSLRSHWKNDPQFNNMWNNGFKGALLDNLLNQFAWDRGALLHDCIHPWGLWILNETHGNLARLDICDNSMKLRYSGAACGTAAYTGAAALLEQMRATKLFDKFFVARTAEIARVVTVATDIRKNRGKYCLNHRFYGHNDVPPLPSPSVQAIAPVLMAYRDVFLKTTTFKDIRAISKVAENADGVRKILAEKMKRLVKDVSTQIDDLV